MTSRSSNDVALQLPNQRNTVCQRRILATVAYRCYVVLHKETITSHSRLDDVHPKTYGDVTAHEQCKVVTKFNLVAYRCYVVLKQRLQ